MKRLGVLAMAILAVTALLTLGSAPHPVVNTAVTHRDAIRAQAASAALTGSQFNPGMIISDSTFYDSTALSASGIQNFLNQQYTGCSSGYTCVRDFKMSTPNEVAESGLCSSYVGAANETAATIFYKVAVACGVNPESLLVTAQKESGLITTSRPNYTTTMGYGCPDSTGCATKYYGFFNQVYLAARQFKLYRLHPTNYGYVAGENNYVLYNPKTSCGGSTVFIQNQATAGLYDYTPYQPNAAALANLHGTGDSCSAYGNRNFWVYFNTWFPGSSGPKINVPYDTGGLVALKSDGSLIEWPNSQSTTAPFPSTAATNVGAAGTWSSYDKLVTGDVTGDGLSDILATKSDGSMYLAVNSGGALPFGSPVRISPPGTWTPYTRIVSADVNGDGFVDLLATKADGSMWLFLSSGSPTAPFGAGTQISNPGAWTYFKTIVPIEINGDGRTDIVATRPDGSLFYFPNSHSTTTPYLGDIQIAPAGTYSTSDTIVAADINTDGRDDLLARHTDGSLWLRLNTAVPSAPFGTSVNVGPGWDTYAQVLSISVQVPRRSVVQTLLGAKLIGGLFATPNVPKPTPFPTGAVAWASGWQQYKQVAVGDVTGDGLADIVTTDSAGKMWLYTGTGKNPGAFTPRTQIGAGFTGWRNFTLVNADGDRRADLLATIPDGSLWLFLNTGSATKPYALDAAHKIKIEPAGWYQWRAMAAVDLNSDGHLDLMVATQAGALQVFYGNGSTTTPFGTPTTVSASGWQDVTHLFAVGSTSVGAAPANVVATHTDGTMWFYRNSGDTKYPLISGQHVQPDGWSAYSQLQVGNVAGKGLTDLVGITPAGALWVFPDHTVDLFGTQGPLAPGWTIFDRIAVGDVNGDGRPDIVATTPTGQLFYYPAGTNPANPYSKGYQQTGTGQDWLDYNRILVADVTGDGRADILATRSNGAMFLFQAGTNSTQPFTGGFQSGSGYQNYKYLAAGDVTGDGLADIVGVKTDGTIWRQRNVHNPRVPMGTPVQIGSGFAAFNRFQLGDIEGIGRADLIATKPDGTMWVCHSILGSATPFSGCVRSTTTNWSLFGLFGL